MSYPSHPFEMKGEGECGGGAGQVSLCHPLHFLLHLLCPLSVPPFPPGARVSCFPMSFFGTEEVMETIFFLSFFFFSVCLLWKLHMTGHSWDIAVFVLYWQLQRQLLLFLYHRDWNPTFKKTGNLSKSHSLQIWGRIWGLICLLLNIWAPDFLRRKGMRLNSFPSRASYLMIETAVLFQ